MGTENPFHPFKDAEDYNAAIEKYNESMRWQKMVNQYGLRQATPGLWRARRKSTVKAIGWLKEPPLIICLLALVGFCYLAWLSLQ